MSHILVVSHDGIGLAQTLSALNAAGYRATGACSFEAAKRVSDRGSPDLVIADQRLGAFNGLHVILRARVENPNVGAILIGAERSRALEADARSLNVWCMVKPQNPARWVVAISRTLQVQGVAGPRTLRGEAIQSIHHN